MAKLLKKCPDCGTKRIVLNLIWSRRWYEPKYFYECIRCHFCGKSAYTKNGAVRRWNRMKGDNDD